MKRFLVGTLLFLVILVSIDFLFGYVCDQMVIQSQTGGTASRQYLAYEADEDIVMFGASRMSHHYDPKIFEKSFGYSCYNAGEDGYGILFSYGMLNLLLKHHTPKMIVYDICDFDFKPFDPIQQMELLKPYYKEIEIETIFSDVIPSESYKMKSAMYRYNSMFFRLAAGYFGYGSKRESGYIPMEGCIDYDVKSSSDSIAPKVDIVKLEYVRKLIRLCKEMHIDLTMCISPNYMAKHSYAFDRVKKVCEEEGIIVFDHFADSTINKNGKLFYDKDHMNSIGATLYTKKLIQEIKDENH